MGGSYGKRWGGTENSEPGPSDHRVSPRVQGMLRPQATKGSLPPAAFYALPGLKQTLSCRQLVQLAPDTASAPA